MSPVAGHVLFSLGPVWNAAPLSGGRANPSLRTRIAGQSQRGELIASAPLASNFRYRVHGGISAPGFVPEARRRDARLDVERARALLEIPADLDARVQQLADDTVAGATDPVEKAARLRRFLLTQFTYTLEQPNGDKAEPLYAFLLEDRRGHCEYFASAYALLLRSQGIAARVVGGYQGGVWDDSEEVVVFLGRNAHAWVEWFLPGAGWIVDDPTPLATAPRAELEGLAALLERVRRFWDDRVIDFALQDQKALLDEIRGGLGSGAGEGRGPAVLGAVAVVVMAAVLWALLRRRGASSGRPGARHRVGAALVAALERCREGSLPPELTLREAVDRLEGAVSPAERQTLERALGEYEADRFGGAPMDEARVAEVVRELAEIPSRGGMANPGPRRYQASP